MHSDHACCASSLESNFNAATPSVAGVFSACCATARLHVLSARSAPKLAQVTCQLALHRPRPVQLELTLVAQVPRHLQSDADGQQAWVFNFRN
jgi:hypothetical protein